MLFAFTSIRSVSQLTAVSVATSMVLAVPALPLARTWARCLPAGVLFAPRNIVIPRQRAPDSTTSPSACVNIAIATGFRNPLIAAVCVTGMFNTIHSILYSWFWAVVTMITPARITVHAYFSTMRCAVGIGALVLLAVLWRARRFLGTRGEGPLARMPITKIATQRQLDFGTVSDAADMLCTRLRASDIPAFR